MKVCEEQDGFADKLLEKLKAHSAEMPRLYQHGETMLLPLLCRAEEDAAFEKTALLQTGAGQTELPEAQAEMARLWQSSLGQNLLAGRKTGENSSLQRICDTG